MEKKQKRSIFKLLNPKNLQKEVHIYGYNFSWKTQAVITFCAIIGIIALSILFQLEYAPIFAVLVITLMLLPILIKDTYKHMYEQKRFSDAVTYVEQLLYSFQKSEKILSALEECATIFNEGEMKSIIEEAVWHIKNGIPFDKEKGVLQEGLEIISNQYNCTKIKTAHELLINCENDGGDIRKSITLILEDIEVWKRRSYKLHAMKKQGHIDNIMSIIMSTILSAFTLYILEYMSTIFPTSNVMNIFQHPAVQITSLLFILFSMYAYKKSSHSLTNNWLVEETSFSEEKLEELNKDITKYEEKNTLVKSICLAAPFFLLAIPLYIFWSKIASLVSILVGILMLIQHKLGRNLAKKDMEKALYIGLPQWLMQLAILLQNNNVQVSIMKSIKNAPVVLKKELNGLVERITVEPNKIKSYTDFCSKYDIPEAQSCMKMLHSISESGIGDADTQIDNLLKQMNKMQDQADEIANEDILFRIRTIFMYPLFAASLKMLVDLTLGMFVLFQLFGGLGV